MNTTPRDSITASSTLLPMDDLKTVFPPTREDIQQLSQSLGFQLNPEELHVYQEQIASSLSSCYQRIRELPDLKLPVTYPRDSGYRPPANENPFNAWYWKCQVKGAPQGKLHGKTVVIKDHICVAGVPMTMGSRALDGYIADIDATVVVRVLDNGGTIVGKAVCEDLCCSGGSVSASTGPVTNPHDKTRMACGSSSGCAVLLVTGAVDMAIGGDQGGSIRNPSSRCGVVGMKPTYGLVPHTGACPLETSLDHVGPMARSVYDVALLLEVIAGYDDGRDARQPMITRQDIPYTDQLKQGVSGLRIGVLKEGFHHPNSEPDVDTMVREAAECVAGRTGIAVEEVSVPMHYDGKFIHSVINDIGSWRVLFDGNGFGFCDKSYYITSLHQALIQGMKTHSNDMGEELKQLALMGKYLHDHDQGALYSKAQNLGRMLGQAYDEALNEVDVLILPTNPMKAKHIPSSSSTLKERLTLFGEHSANTCPFNVTGHPALSIPAGLSQGLPVGMMIIGRKFDDSTVLRVAYEFEQIREGSMEPRLNGSEP